MSPLVGHRSKPSQAEWFAHVEVDRLFSLSLDLFCVIDPEGRLQSVSPTFAKTLGYSDSDLVGRPLKDLLHTEDLSDTLAHIEHLRTDQGVQRFRTRHRRKHGGLAWICWTAGLDSQGQIYAIGRDVTAQLRARDELGRRALEIEVTNQELREFARVASHDLQEPLRAVASYAQIVEERYTDVLDGDGRQFLGYIAEATDRMSALVHSLSKYAGLSGRTLEPAPLDVNAVVNQVLGELRDSVEESSAQIQVDFLPTLRADPLLFPVLVRNLVSNAIKFRDTRPLEIQIAAASDPEGWCFIVADNGIGVAAPHREKIFEVFKRLHPQGEYEGTGIGLALCRRIVRQHGGVIHCSERTGGGSVFEFTIPQDRAAR